jgi:hypothetical protein
MARIRITIEYDLDGTALEDERKQWLAGHVDVADIQAASDQGDTSASVKFEEIGKPVVLATFQNDAPFPQLQR